MFQNPFLIGFINVLFILATTTKEDFIINSTFKSDFLFYLRLLDANLMITQPTIKIEISSRKAKIGLIGV